MMKFVLVIVACLIAAAMAGPLSEDQYQFLFTKFTQQYNKKYETNDFFGRYATFKSNLDLILAHNSNPNETFRMGVNQFADYTAAEFTQLMGLGRFQAKPMQTIPLQKTNLRTVIDWTDKSNPVKNQGQCGSCWAFSANGATEPRYNILENKLYDLSEQQLVSCVTRAFDPSFISEGCRGGLMSEAHKFTAKYGVCLTEDYGYTGRDDACIKTCRPVLQSKGQLDVKDVARDDQFLKLLADGPISVGLAASSSAFQFYSSGVVTGCKDRSLNHGVVLMGVNTEDAIPFYYIKNSWGASWGDKGFIKLAIEGQQCGLATSPWDSIPLF